MEPTETERLLRQAHQICQTITDRVDVSDELLRTVFDRLCLELELSGMDDDLDLPGVHGSIH
ncbi:hypothetical protein [Paracandidimonas soli]|uniref:hypothetical protein n=1 Tax=Paracandidimonas soli TaxID=1917182 RepID=UPI001054094E|nr:hypothetical protein [Paracandidimonas soli]